MCVAYFSLIMELDGRYPTSSIHNNDMCFESWFTITMLCLCNLGSLSPCIQFRLLEGFHSCAFDVDCSIYSARTRICFQHFQSSTNIYHLDKMILPSSDTEDMSNLLRENDIAFLPLLKWNLILRTSVTYSLVICLPKC